MSAHLWACNNKKSGGNCCHGTARGNVTGFKPVTQQGKAGTDAVFAPQELKIFAGRLVIIIRVTEHTV